MRFDPTTGRYMPVGKQLPWRNSFFATGHGLSLYSLSKGAQRTHNPIYWQSYLFFPRWNFTPSFSLRLQQGVAVELTKSDGATRHRQAILSDTIVDLVEANLSTLAGVIVGVGARLTLPTSIFSRASNRLAGTGLRLALTKSISGVAGGLVLQGLGSYSRWWASSNVASVSDQARYPCTLSGVTGDISDTACDQVGAASALKDLYVGTLSAQMMLLEGWTVSTGLSFIWARGYGLADGAVHTLTGTVVLPDQSLTHWRNFTSFSVSTAYMFADWIMAALAIGSPPLGDLQLRPDGSRRNPFFSRNAQLSLSAIITLDQLYGALTPSS